uniref:Ubiquitin-like protease family profile domain-containing protein n=1 Tax=Oryza punctata TaxID=4537 RepID=A0A0E0L5Q3_ORYPU
MVAKLYVSFRWLEESCDEDITGVWFKHNKPTPIEISAEEFKIQVSHGGILRADLCSALIRLYQQLDAKMNTNPSGQRWRHFFPPQFAKALMFEPNFSSMKAVSDMFDQHISGYKIQNCQLLISPVQLTSGTWACYIWDMEKRQMHILDRVLQHREISDVSAKHRQSATMIHTGLLTCINKFFDDWDINPDGWTCTYYTMISPRGQRWNSGFYTLYYAREVYDGKLSNVLDSGSFLPAPDYGRELRQAAKSHCEILGVVVPNVMPISIAHPSQMKKGNSNGSKHQINIVQDLLIYYSIRRSINQGEPKK